MNEDLDKLPGLPQVTYRLKTLEEFAITNGREGPNDVSYSVETKLDYLLLVVKMLNFGVNDDGFKNIPEAQKILFVRRDDIYYDEKRKLHFLKEDRPNETTK